MTSSKTMLTWVLVAVVFRLSSETFDTSVCVPAKPTVPVPPPAAVLGAMWEAAIEWKDNITNRTYVINDYADMPVKMEKLVISLPLQPDVTVLYDWSTVDVIVEETVSVSPTESRLHCQVVRHSNSRDLFSYRGMFWLTSLSVLLEKFASAQDAILTGPTVVRGIQAEKWTACLYNIYTNTTLRANLYLSSPSWQSPHVPLNNQVPVRLEYWGRQHNGSDVSDISLVGDVMDFQIKEPDHRFPPGTFTTQPGSFCPDRTGQSKRFPHFPEAMSLLREIVDIDFTRIYYEELWYDSTLQMARLDTKAPTVGDSDPQSYIMDFQAGMKYKIDKYMTQCTPLPLEIGDYFVTWGANRKVAMMSTDEYFEAKNAAIQYVGQDTVRDVLCDTWIGRYYDPNTLHNTTVQWYFTAKEWLEHTGDVVGSGEFFMMKHWMGGSRNPTVYNIMRYSPIPPDFIVFDYAACYSHDHKKHFTIEWAVSDMEKLVQLSLPYLKLQMVKTLADRLEITLNRFSDVSVDQDKVTSSVFMSAILLDATRGSSGQPQISLEGALAFLNVSINSHYAFNISTEETHITLTGIGIVVHNFRKDFDTTTTTPHTTTELVAPTIAPSKRPTTQSTTATTNTIPTPHTICPTAPTCACPSTVMPSSCPPVVTCPICPPPPTPCPLCPTCRTCPPCFSSSPHSSSVLRCPSPAPCPTISAVGSAAPGHQTATGHCQCTTPTTQASVPCRERQTSAVTGITAGALAGGIVGALLLGLAAGIISSRLYHLLRVSPDQMTINLLDDDM